VVVESRAPALRLFWPATRAANRGGRVRQL